MFWNGLKKETSSKILLSNFLIPETTVKTFDLEMQMYKITDGGFLYIKFKFVILFWIIRFGNRHNIILMVEINNLNI